MGAGMGVVFHSLVCCPVATTPELGRLKPGVSATIWVSHMDSRDPNIAFSQAIESHGYFLKMMDDNSNCIFLLCFQK